jgi:hypothetical protein
MPRVRNAVARRLAFTREEEETPVTKMTKKAEAFEEPGAVTENFVLTTPSELWINSENGILQFLNTQGTC